MLDVEITRHVEAPPDAVFAAFTDFAHSAERIEAIRAVEVLTDGPVGVGTRFRETRVMFGREATEEMEVTVFEPPSRFETLAESHGSRYRAVFTFEPRGGGTDVTMSFAAEPLTFVARIMGVLMKPFVARMMQACAKDLEDVKAWVEAGETHAGSVR